MEPEPIDPVVTDPAAIVTDPNARTWGMLAHALTLLGYLGGIAHVVPALIVYLAKKDEHEFIADQARESLNFQITLLPILLILTLMTITVIFMCISIPLLSCLLLYQLVMVIVASIQANEGKRFRYPLTLRLVK
jgi:uncharacterized Tic20 family protein